MSPLSAQAESACDQIPSDAEKQTKTTAKSLESELYVKESTLRPKKPERQKQARAVESVIGVCDEISKVDPAEKENRPTMPVSFLSGMWRNIMITRFRTSTAIS